MAQARNGNPFAETYMHQTLTIKQSMIVPLIIPLFRICLVVVSNKKWTFEGECPNCSLFICITWPNLSETLIFLLLINPPT